MKKIIFSIIAILLVLYLVIKGVLFFAYDLTKINENTNAYNFIKSFDIEEKITIEKTSAKDYLEYEGLKIRNDFKLFKEFENHIVYEFKNSGAKITFQKVPVDETVNLILSMSKDSLLSYDLTKEFEKNKINNGYKAYQYLINNIDNDISVFSSINKIRKAQTVNFISNTFFGSNIKKLVLIDGNLDGYIWEEENIKEIHINHNDDDYIITITSFDYTDEDLVNLISTIEFE